MAHAGRAGRGALSVALLCVLAVHEARAAQVPPPPPACDQLEAAVRADSNNLDAASRLGRCSFRDYVMVAPDGDSSRLAFRSSWSTALRALRRAVDHDPTYAAAYRPLFNILFATTRDGCSTVTGECWQVSPVLRDADSVITIPQKVQLNVPGIDSYREADRESQAAQRPSLVEARALAERWLSVAPNDRRPHEYLGRALLLLNDPAAAATEFEQAVTLGTAESKRALFWERLEAFVKANRGSDARSVLDEALADPGRDTAQIRAFSVASLNALLGRYRPPQPPPVDSARQRAFRARLDSMIRSRPLTPPRPPDFSTLLARGDTAGARLALAGMDSAMASADGSIRIPRFGPGYLQWVEYHLALRDTSGAEARLAEIDRPFNERRFRFNTALLFGDPYPWMGRAWLLAGDLAAARHRPDDAARIYRRVIGLWGGGDADLEPVVQQARSKLAALSAR